jgi:hypothetical protein
MALAPHLLWILDLMILFQLLSITARVAVGLWTKHIPQKTAFILLLIRLRMFHKNLRKPIRIQAVSKTVLPNFPIRAQRMMMDGKLSISRLLWNLN